MHWRPSVAPVRGQETRAQRQVPLRFPSAYGGFIPVPRMILHSTHPAPHIFLSHIFLSVRLWRICPGGAMILHYPRRSPDINSRDG